MPIYEYKCQTCGHEFEEIVGSGEEKSPICPVCKSDQTRKILSAPNVGAGQDEGFGMSSMPPAGGCGGGAFN